jgi:sarcosine oxidase
MPPDRDFVIDFVPGQSRIAVCIGAGHAAKFAGLLGRILAELVVDGRSAFPIGAFRADRPALTDPSFEPAYRLGGAVAS